MTRSETGDRRVVVGVAPSKAGREALAWGLAEAERRGATLELVRITGSPTERDAWMLDDALMQVGQTDVPVRAVLVRGRPERELPRAGMGAELLVIGAPADRRRAPRPSVAARCLRNPPCQVAVFHADATVAALAGFGLPGAR